MRRSSLLLALVVIGCSSAEVAPDEPGRADTASASPAPTHGVPIDDGPARRADAVQVEAPVLTTSFEPASAACNDWTEAGGDAIRSVPAHAGDYACRICATGDATEMSIARDVGPLPAGRYTMTAWVRTRPNASAPPQVSALFASSRASVTVNDVYQRIDVVVDLTTTSTVHARIAASAVAGDCMLVDDVTIRRD